MSVIPKVISTALLLFGSIAGYTQTDVKAEDFIEKANKGDMVAQCQLAECYHAGYGIKKDLSQAVYWFTKSAEQGYEKAQYSLGRCYYAGIGVLTDKKRANYWWEKAAEQGNSDAQFHLALSYQLGNGVKKNIYQGFYWAKKAAEQGNVDAQYNVGLCYCNGQGVDKDIKQTVYWWAKAAEQGDGNAQNALGSLYESGQGFPKDHQQAAYWYQKAAEEGNSRGQSNLGKLYFHGLGVVQNYSKAVSWFRKAAAQDDDDGVYYLGLCYHHGYGVEKDASQAVYYYKKSINSGYGGIFVLLTLANLYEEIQDYHNSHAIIDNAPDYLPDVLELKGLLCIDEGDKEKAMEYWHKLKSQFPERANGSTKFCCAMLDLEKDNDVDINIPTSQTISANTFAFIIANESYTRVTPVPFAKNDGSIFVKYCKKTIGIPEKNVRVWNNASLGDMQYAITKIQQIAEAYDGEASIILYYVGHGIPSDDQQNSYLLPIDGYGADESCISLRTLYETLGLIKAKSVIVILDACFSGAQRNGEMLASTRGVCIKPKQEVPKGNLIVLSAAQGDETALPYNEKGHGLFTYFLLRKLQESNGNCSIGELSDYVITNVKRTSISIGDKLQTPIVSTSTNKTDWRNITLK